MLHPWPGAAAIRTSRWRSPFGDASAPLDESDTIPQVRFLLGSPFLNVARAGAASLPTVASALTAAAGALEVAVLIDGMLFRSLRCVRRRRNAS
jgi:hypothetical protein